MFAVHWIFMASELVKTKRVPRPQESQGLTLFSGFSLFTCGIRWHGLGDLVWRGPEAGCVVQCCQVVSVRRAGGQGCDPTLRTVVALKPNQQQQASVLLVRRW